MGADRLMNLPNREKLTHLIKEDLNGVNDRIKTQFELAASDEVDKIVFVVGCDDSREDVPIGLEKIEDEQGNKITVLFHYVPVIGGGIPDPVLSSVLRTYESRGISKAKMMVFTTQHGAKHEIDSIFSNEEVAPTCGLRGVLANYQEDINSILANEGERREQLMAKLAERSGLVQGLIQRALDTNRSPDIVENQQFVTQTTREMMNAAGFGDVPLWGGYYDHNNKVMHLSDKGRMWILEVPDMQRWDKPYQDPVALVQSHGEIAAAVHDGVIFRNIIGSGANNDFSSASIDEGSLLSGSYEHIYSLKHVGGHGEDHNFEDTELMIYVCDNEEKVDEVLEMLKDEKFRGDFGELLRKLGGVYVANLEMEDFQFVEFN